MPSEMAAKPDMLDDPYALREFLLRVDEKTWKRIAFEGRNDEKSPFYDPIIAAFEKRIRANAKARARA